MSVWLKSQEVVVKGITQIAIALAKSVMGVVGEDLGLTFESQCG
jgi:hypothetical protein